MPLLSTTVTVASYCALVSKSGALTKDKTPVLEIFKALASAPDKL